MSVKGEENLCVVGLMSGTSLDGLDMACCSIGPRPQAVGAAGRVYGSEGLFCAVLAAETVPYPASWSRRLRQLPSTSALDYALADVELGHYMGQQVRAFVERRGLHPDLVASHGHTVFHQPQRGLTTQIACGDAIAAETGLPTVFNFRRLDVALGGQGAPLVPVGDRLLFGAYDVCLNLGGFANLSLESDGQRVAYDICPCNLPLNLLAQRLGLPYDRGGARAAQGTVDEGLLMRLNAIPYYNRPAPKSLGFEWLSSAFLPLVMRDDMSESEVQDSLRTVVEHVAVQISQQVAGARTVLVTGGGAYNSLLLQRLRALQPDVQFVVPEPELVEFKEAIVFALLGYLRVRQQTNTWASVTAARCDSVGGQLSGLF